MTSCVSLFKSVCFMMSARLAEVPFERRELREDVMFHLTGSFVGVLGYSGGFRVGNSSNCDV